MSRPHMHFASTAKVANDEELKRQLDDAYEQAPEEDAPTGCLLGSLAEEPICRLRALPVLPPARRQYAHRLAGPF